MCVCLSLRASQGGLHPLQKPGLLPVHRERHGEDGGGRPEPREEAPGGQLSRHRRLHQQRVEQSVSHRAGGLHPQTPEGNSTPSGRGWFIFFVAMSDYDITHTACLKVALLFTGTNVNV